MFIFYIHFSYSTFHLNQFYFLELHLEKNLTSLVSQKSILSGWKEYPIRSFERERARSIAPARSHLGERWETDQGGRTDQPLGPQGWTKIPGRVNFMALHQEDFRVVNSDLSYVFVRL